MTFKKIVKGTLLLILGYTAGKASVDDDAKIKEFENEYTFSEAAVHIVDSFIAATRSIVSGIIAVFAVIIFTI